MKLADGKFSSNVSNEDILTSLCKDEAHCDLARFDANKFAESLKAQFSVKDNEDDSLIIEVIDFTNSSANWIFLDIPLRFGEDSMNDLLTLVDTNDLYLIDECGDCHGGKLPQNKWWKFWG